ncbi:MAG: aldehyde ferredoxin oxidoreductase family protein [Spirochaetaceae bacterium]|nr:MAG: aldehyde ferredoxin oxidoreductase family protein [Spirochaetaceae bacterium]
MRAVTGRILSVDLKSGRCDKETIPQSMYRQYLGGYGLGAALLLERMNPACDPLGPENILGFAAGYLTGTGAYIASRFMVFGKSPSTGGWGDANCGGYFGPKLKAAGVDGILFSEISDAPVYLFVEADSEGSPQAQLLPAEQLWGRDCYDTEDLLKERHGSDCQVACIGPAGENLSMVAGISTDKGRFAARSALGTVMGSKRLKAVVLRGKLRPELADPEEMRQVRKKHISAFRDEVAEGLRDFGTPWFYKAALEEGDVPVKNWASSMEELKNPDSLGDVQVLKYQIKRYACSGCPIGCGGHLNVESGPFKTESSVHKLEYESMSLLGPNLLIEDVEALIRLNDLCNRYGLDTIGTGGLVAFAIECFEQGVLKPEQTGGLELRWGNTRAVVTLVESMGRGEGFGALLSKGFDHLISVLGEESRQYAMAVRNEALPAHDPRWSAGLALTYYSDPTPARHTQGSTTFPVAGYDMPDIPSHQAKGRSKAHWDNVAWTHTLNAAGLCLFGYIVLDYKSLPEFMKAADGTAWGLEELKHCGLRIALLRQIFNHKAGIDFRKYPFPARALGDPPLKQGATKDVRVDLDTMVKDYFEESNLDRSTALPPRELAEELGIASHLG